MANTHAGIDRNTELSPISFQDVEMNDHGQSIEPVLRSDRRISHTGAGTAI